MDAWAIYIYFNKSINKFNLKTNKQTATWNSNRLNQFNQLIN